MTADVARCGFCDGILVRLTGDLFQCSNEDCAVVAREHPPTSTVQRCPRPRAQGLLTEPGERRLEEIRAATAVPIEPVSEE